MKILLAGNWRAEIHEESLSRGLARQGCSVIPFKWNGYFAKSQNPVFKIVGKFQYKYLRGGIIGRINKDLVDAVLKEEIDLLFLYRPNLVWPETLQKIKQFKPELVVSGYNNDDPFSNAYPNYVWRIFLKAIPYYDILYAYRPSNISQYYSAGAKSVELLPPWYDPDISFPSKDNSGEVRRYDCDIVFIGHYEDDGRIETIRKMVASGLNVRLFGPNWDSKILNDPDLGHLYPVSYLSGDAYSKALYAAKMALVIYSSLNNDVYTRRCFEIPATGTLMVAKRSSEMLELYEEDIEAIFFDDDDELIDKVRKYSTNEAERLRIADNGLKRVRDSGYDVSSRAKTIVDTTHV